MLLLEEISVGFVLLTAGCRLPQDGDVDLVAALVQGGRRADGEDGEDGGPVAWHLDGKIAEGTYG